MRFGSLSAKGYSLMAVAGSKFDPGTFPAAPDLPIRESPVLARAAIRAVQRARVISYVERGILPASALRNEAAHLDERDEHCIHLIVHRGNCLHGAIRCQFHRRNSAPTGSPWLYQEVFARNGLPESASLGVKRQLAELCQDTEVDLETSGWLVNPDLRHSAIIAISLPAALWALARPCSAFAGISTIRASNGALKMLKSLGGIPIHYQDEEILLHDPFYRGPVQFLAMHSQRHDSAILHLVDEIQAGLKDKGIMIITRDHYQQK